MSHRARFVLVADDELAIRRLVGAALRRDGHAVEEATAAAEALWLAEHGPVLAMLDLGLPDRNGLEATGPLREAGDAVTVLTARDRAAERAAAVDLGADDSVTKPFATDEVLAPGRAALRRRSETRGARRRLRVGDLDLDARRVRRGGVEVHLTQKESALMAVLAAHPGRVLTHAQLLREVREPAHEADVERLRVAVRALGCKREADPADPCLIRSEPGVGYRMADPDRRPRADPPGRSPGVHQVLRRRGVVGQRRGRRRGTAAPRRAPSAPSPPRASPRSHAEAGSGIGAGPCPAANVS